MMMDRTVHHEEELFDAARRLPDASKRKAFLDFACGDDVALRQRIEELLAAHDESETFFRPIANRRDADVEVADTPSSPNTPDSGEEEIYREAIGARIGRYRLVEKLGEGGCGVVYLAEQVEPVSRRVALKIVRFGMETKSVILRFEAERQALAMMDHPNIARVFDAGETADGSPYFVMEYVQGERITAYCDERGLALRARLDLFVDICHAIQHAHQKGVVHGDIKPSNIMVAIHDGRPVPKVIDFGISRVTDAGLTENIPLIAYAQLIGTPAYMSPEQVERGVDVDTRSDIYSLGVLLYEMLTGCTPFEAGEMTLAGAEKLCKALREHRPVPPSEKLASIEADQLHRVAKNRGLTPPRLLAHVRGDLDAIVMKALQKDRRHRYETANGLASEIERFLNDEPVIAHDAGWSYRFRKLVRRNRGVFAGVGAVALALIAGIGVSTRLYLKERQARSRAVAAERQEADLRRQAEIREQVTQAALLISQEDFAGADAMLDRIEAPPTTLETAAVYRAVGEWHAMHGRWARAAKRLGRLVKVNLVDTLDVASLDMLELSPALVEAGDVDGYAQFRLMAIERFRAAETFTDRILKACLLQPVDAELLAALEPYVQKTLKAHAQAEETGDVFQAAWISIAIATYKLRRGDFAEAAAWSRRCLAYPDENLPRGVTARVVLVMALQGLGEDEEARSLLEDVRRDFAANASALRERGGPTTGFWFDWVYGRILLREAESLMAGPGSG